LYSNPGDLSRTLSLVSISLFVSLVLGCGTSTIPLPNSSTTSSGQQSGFTIAPASADVHSGSYQQFQISKGSSNSGVSWSVDDIQGGSQSSGTITSSGLYAAPATDTLLQVHIKAGSQSDPAIYSEGIVTISPASTNGSSSYYVSTAGNDSNNGSATAPWRTIAYAASQIGPGATVHVGPGTYTGSIVTSVSGNSSSRVRFISDRQWAAVIGGTSGEAVWQNLGDYVDIVGFEVSGPNANGIENLGSNVQILSNHVHDIIASCDSNGGSGINNANYSAHDNDINGNIVHDVRAPANCATPHGVGIYHSNLRGHIYNNISFHNGTVGIQLWHAANAVVVANNTVVNNSVNGIVIGAGDSPGGVTNDNSEVENNISVNNAYYGIQEFGQTGSHNQYVNNIVYQNPSGNLTLLTGRASGTITGAPLLVNPTGLSSNDYQLQTQSPAIGAGTSQYAPSQDFQGAVRPSSKAPDIGAFQSGATPGIWPWQ
jgi:hypothetical protein